MKWLPRWFFNCACLCSTLLCLAVSVICVRSYWVGEFWLWYDNKPFASNGFRVGCGFIQYSWQDVSRMSGANMTPGHYRYPAPSKSQFTSMAVGQTHYALPGLRFDQSQGNYRSYRLAHAHLAWPAVLTAILPALWVVQWRRHRRRGRAGLCPVCGYDLRASPDRCPECGTHVKLGEVHANFISPGASNPI